MKRWLTAIAVFGMVAAGAAPAQAAAVDFVVGLYGGASFPLEGDADTGSVLGAKLRVLTPIPMLAAEAYYQRIGQEDVEDVWNEGDVAIDLEGDALEVAGADILVGSLRGTPLLRWYGIAGVNFVEFDLPGSDEYRMGGELGVGLEIVPPAIGLSVEARGMISFIGVGDEPDPKVATLTVGLNYDF
ncbi:MAG: outer membrane beta-barrel protein [Candidatus Eisenbacteria bacterium]|nr:outer membrane beta-barrel protein [Candidatus Eisenbacteria bacterium]